MKDFVKIEEILGFSLEDKVKNHLKKVKEEAKDKDYKNLGEP